MYLQGADNVVLDPVTGLRVVEASRGHVEVDSYGNEIKEESKIDTLKASTKEERLRRTFEAIDEDESGASSQQLSTDPLILCRWQRTLGAQDSSSVKNFAS